MKKYIKASINYSGLYDAIKLDRRAVASLDPDTTTYDDLHQIEWKSGKTSSWIVDHNESTGQSVSDCIEDLLDAFQERLRYCKDEMNKAQDYTARAEQLRETLNVFLDDTYDVIDETEFSWIIDPQEDATHEDCIAFVDDIVNAIDGKYNGTGRGGSWTSWDLISSDGVRVKAGWTRDDMWYVEIQY